MKEINEVRKVIKPEYKASIDEIVEIIMLSKDPFKIACNSFNFGYSQALKAVGMIEDN